MSKPNASAVEYDEYPDLVTVACVNFALSRDDVATGAVEDSDALSGSQNGGPIDHEASKALRVERMCKHAREAARQGAQLVVFPESALAALGPKCETCSPEGGPCQVHLDAAELVPGPSSNVLAELAAELGVYIIFGIDERDPDDDSIIYNAAVLVAPEGIRGAYRKLHLGHPLETQRYSPGSELPVWQTSIGPIGILICYDFSSNPELSRILALKGARILVNPTRSADHVGKADYVRNTTVVRATENLVYAMSANWTGDTGSGVAVGNSTIAGPAFPAFNNILAAADSREQVLVATLNFKQLGRWYDLFPWSEWRLDRQRQLAVTKLVAEEFQALVDDNSDS